MRWSLFLVASLLFSSCGFVKDERSEGLRVAPGAMGPSATSGGRSGDGLEPPSATPRAVGGATEPLPSRQDRTNEAEVLAIEQLAPEEPTEQLAPEEPIEQRAPEEPGVTEWSPPVDDEAVMVPGSASSTEVTDLWWALGAVPPVKQSEGVFTLLADPRVPPDSACFAAWRFLRRTLHLSATPSSTVDPDVYANRLDSARRSLEQLIALTSGRLADKARDVAAVLDRMAGLVADSYGPDIIRSFGDSLIGGPGLLLDGLVEWVAFSCPTVASGRPQVPFFWAEDA